MLDIAISTKISYTGLFQGHNEGHAHQRKTNVFSSIASLSKMETSLKEKNLLQEGANFSFMSSSL